MNIFKYFKRKFKCFIKGHLKIYPWPNPRAWECVRCNPELAQYRSRRLMYKDLIVEYRSMCKHVGSDEAVIQLLRRARSMAETIDFLRSDLKARADYTSALEKRLGEILGEMK